MSVDSCRESVSQHSPSAQAMNIFVAVRALFDNVSLQVNRGDRIGA